MTERLLIEITEKGARVVKRNIEDIGKTAKTSASSVDFLKRALGLLGGAAIARQLLGYADSFTVLRNQVRVAVGELGDLDGTLNKLFDIANKTRTPIEANVQLFQRLSFAAGELGASNQQLFQFVDSVAKSLAIQGGNAESAAGALLQLSQAVGSGIVRAEEFNSILEGAFPIALQVAKGLDAAGGSVSKLRNLIIKGKVTSTDFFNALLKQSAEIDRIFAQTVPTVSQAFTVLRNNLIKYIGEADQATGVTRFLSQAILYLANNLDTVAAALLVVSGVLAGTFAVSLVNQIRSIGTALLAAFANPLTLIVALIGAASTALYVFRDDITLFAKEGITLGDVFVGAADAIRTAWDDLGAWFTSFWESVKDGVNEVGSVIGVSFESAGEVVSTVLNFLIARVVVGPRLIINAFRQIPGALADIFISAMNGVVAIVERAINKIIGSINAVSEFAGLGKLADVSLGRIDNAFEGRARALAESSAQVFVDTFSQDFVGQIGDGLKDLGKRGQILRLSDALVLDARAQDTSNAARKKAIELTDKESSSLKSLLDKLDPIGAAKREVAEATQLLNKAVAAGLLTDGQRAAALEQLAYLYRDQLDPLGAVNRELTKERELLMLSAKEREVQNRYLEIEEKLRVARVRLTNEQAAALRNELTALQALNDQKEREERILQEIRGPQLDYAANLQALNSLMAQGSINGAEYETALRNLRITFLETQTDLGSGIERAFLKMEAQVADSASTAEKLLTDAFGAGEKAIEQFVTTGKVEIGEMVREIAAQLIKLGIQQALVGLGNSLGFGAGVSGGGFNVGSLVTGLLGFANGGDFTVGPSNTLPIGSGIDNRIVAFKARDRERVTITPPGQQPRGGGGRNLTFNVYTPDADSFRRSQGQLLARAAAVTQRANWRNN